MSVPEAQRRLNAAGLVFEGRRDPDHAALPAVPRVEVVFKAHGRSGISGEQRRESLPRRYAAFGRQTGVKPVLADDLLLPVAEDLAAFAVDEAYVFLRVDHDDKQAGNNEPGNHPQPILLECVERVSQFHTSLLPPKPHACLWKL